MPKWMIYCAIVIGFASGLSSVPAESSEQDLEIGDFALVATQRVSRTEFDFTYQAIVTNLGGNDLQNVGASATSASPHTVVIDGDLDFGDVQGGEEAYSIDTFTIRQNRRFPFNWADLAWNFTAQMPSGNAAWIGPAGGVVDGEGGASLIVPPGALSEQRLISFQAHLGEATLPGPLLDFRGGGTFGPSGLVFDLPVTVSLPLNATLDPGTEYPLYQFDPADGSWTETEFLAVVAPDGQSATADVTHFSTFVIVGSILEPGLAEIFGLLSRDAGHVLYSQLFADYESRLSDLFQVGAKSVHTFGGDPLKCYENVGLDVVLDYVVTEVAEVGEPLVQIEEDVLSSRSGREGTIKIEYNYETDKKISTTDPNAVFPGDTEHLLRANVNVWISCAAPDLTLFANKPVLDAIENEQADVTAQLTCGADPFPDQQITFNVFGRGMISSNAETTGADGTAKTTLTALTNQTCTADSASVTAEYLACAGEPEETTVQKIFDMPTEFVLDGEWTSVEIADETGCDEGVNVYSTTVTITENNGALDATWAGGGLSGTKSQCAISGFGGESEDLGYTYGGGSGTIATDGRSISASADWVWNGIDPDTGQPDSCSGSSTFTVTR